MEEQKSAFVWIAWFVGLMVLAMEWRSGALSDAPILDHPPTGEDDRGFLRVFVGILALVAFGMLFMATPMAM